MIRKVGTQFEASTADSSGVFYVVGLYFTLADACRALAERAA
jgi:hypothetical protein